MIYRWGPIGQHSFLCEWSASLYLSITEALVSQIFCMNELQINVTCIKPEGSVPKDLGTDTWLLQPLRVGIEWSIDIIQRKVGKADEIGRFDCGLTWATVNSFKASVMFIARGWYFAICSKMDCVYFQKVHTHSVPISLLYHKHIFLTMIVTRIASSTWQLVHSLLQHFMWNFDIAVWNIVTNIKFALLNVVFSSALNRV